MNENEKMHSTNMSLAFIALAVAVLALVMAWTAFNRSGKDVSDVVETNTEQAVSNVSQNTEEVADNVAETSKQAEKRLEIATKLAVIKARIQADEVTDETAVEVAELKRVRLRKWGKINKPHIYSFLLF